MSFSIFNSMSGHSKWANIRVKKTAQDARRGKVFTRHSKLIEIAAQRGGDPVTNAGLRTAIDNAKADSVPNMNIERAIKKGTGDLKGERMEEVLYAAMGPGNVACVIECMTDNKNRTIANVKMAISKNGGSFVESSSVLWMFARKGVVTVKDVRHKTQDISDLELAMIDAGAEDIEQDGDILTVTTDAASWTNVRDLLKSQGYEILSTGLKYIPTQKVGVQDSETAAKLMMFIDAVEEDDDVSEVHTNAKILEEVAMQ